MATALSNLSEYDENDVPNAEKMRFGIVVSEWNGEITDALLKGATDTLLKHGAQADKIAVQRVPGSYELPFGAQTLCSGGSIDAIIAIGSVIRGETAHFDFVCQACAQGIKDVSLKFDIPVIFCVLTDDNMEQSKARSGGKHGNKGTEAAVAAIKMAAIKSEASSWGISFD